MGPVPVYKVFRMGEWRHFAHSGRFGGSADDARDGFIHLSSGGQVGGVLRRHFADETAVVIAEFRFSEGDADLKWESSTGGDLYPHYYGELSGAQVARSRRIEQGAGGFALPEWVEGR